MAVGLPSISSHFPLYKSVLEDHNCGVTVDPMNSRELCEALIKLSADQRLLKTYSENGKKAVTANYNWKTEEVKLMNMYDRILNQG